MRSDAVPILVLGMHRSGTSALTGCLDTLGVSLGSPLLKAQPDNPKGYYELEPVIQVHEKLLKQLGVTFHTPDGKSGNWIIPNFPANWLDLQATVDAQNELLGILANTLSEAALFAIKDPRLCILLPLWLRIFEYLHIRPRFLTIIRDPLEVAQSLRERNHLSPDDSFLLWLYHNTQAEYLTRGYARGVTTYERLLTNPAQEFDRLAVTLGLDWPVSPSSANLTEFLNPDLRHWNGDTLCIDPDNVLQETVRESYKFVSGRIDEDKDIACDDGFCGLPWSAIAARLMILHRRSRPQALQDKQTSIDRLQRANQELFTGNQWLQQQCTQLNTEREKQSQANQELGTINHRLFTTNQELGTINRDLFTENQSLHKTVQDLRLKLNLMSDGVLDDEEHYSLLNHLGDAKLTQGKPEQMAIWDATIDGQSCRAIFLQPPADLTITVPTGARGFFVTAVAIHPDAWLKPHAAGCTFEVRVDNSVSSRIALDPARIPADRQWHRIKLAIPQSTNGFHQLILSTATNEKRGDFCWALWQAPHFVWTDPSHETTGAMQ